MDPHWFGCPESGSVLGMRIKSRSIEIYQNSSKTDVNVPTVSTVINEKPKKNKSYFFLVSWKPFEKSRNRILKPVHRCYDPDPHPSQNVTDPELWLKCYSICRWERIGEEELAFWTWPVIEFYLWGLFGTDCDQDRITWGNPQEWC
jgi:hypothetical protein